MIVEIDRSPLPAARAPSDQIYATPRPLMRGRYLVRSLRGVTFLRCVDAVLRLLRAAPMPTVVPATPVRILICNWAHIGDVLLSLPALQALRTLFPEARIDLLIGRGSVVVVEGTGLYDQLHLVDHFVLSRTKTGRLSRLRTYLRDRRQFLRAARDIKYDVAIDLYCYFPSVSPLLWFGRIPVRCGYTSGGFGPTLTHPVNWSFQDRPIGECGLELIKTLWPHEAAAIKTLKPCYPGYPQANLSPTEQLPKSSYIVIHTGAGKHWKEWPESNWLQLISRFIQSKMPLVFCGVGTKETDRALRLAEILPPHRTFMFVDRSWSDFVSLISDAACVICLESSAAHVAAAFKVPTVAIYSGTNEPQLWGPNNPRARQLSAPTGCAPCHRVGCEAMACVRNVTPEDVLMALRHLGLFIEA